MPYNATPAEAKGDSVETGKVKLESILNAVSLMLLNRYKPTEVDCKIWSNVSIIIKGYIL